MQQIALILASLGVIQATMLGLYLLSLKKGLRLGNTLFAIVLFGLSIRIGKSIFNYYLGIDPWQRNIGLSGLLLVAPSFWLYGKSLFTGFNRMAPRHYIHYFPALVYLCFCWLIPNNYTLAAKISYALVSIQMLTYLILSEGARRRAFTENLASGSLSWYRKLSIGMWIIWSYYAAVFIGWVPYYIGGAITYSVLIYGLSYLMLNRSHFAANKYQSSGIGSSESKRILKRIENLFSEQKIYLNQNLTLENVAEKIDCSSRQVSQAINEHLQKNFSEYVTVHRIEHAKMLLSDSTESQSKIASIAADCGFGNVTSFNIAFKALVNLTPSKFRREYTNV